MMINQIRSFNGFLCVCLFLLNSIEAEPIRSRRDAAAEQGSKNAAEIAQQKCKEYAEYRFVNKSKNSSTSGQSGNSAREMDCINAIPLIVGGVQAEPKEFPHMALIGYGKEFKSVEWLCGGILISEKFVMSTGTCSDPGGKFGSAKWVLLGDISIGSTIIHESKRAVYEVIKRHVHPSYKPKQSVFNDISLFQLNTTVEMSPHVRPACLYASSTVPPFGTKASITGWGATTARGKRSDTLQKATISIIEDKTCELSYNIKSTSSGYDPKTMICAGDLVEGKDACTGDSGGPLQVPVDKEACMWNVLGITSYGRGCANKKDPGVYTKVPYYLDWIQSIVWP